MVFLEPTISVEINPDRLAWGDQTTIRVEAVTPGESDLDGLTLVILYGAENDPGGVVIHERPLSLGAGETTSQEIAWTVDYIPSSGSYEVRAALLLPDNVQLTLAVAPVELLSP